MALPGQVIGVQGSRTGQFTYFIQLKLAILAVILTFVGVVAGSCTAGTYINASFSEIVGVERGAGQHAEPVALVSVVVVGADRDAAHGEGVPVQTVGTEGNAHSGGAVDPHVLADGAVLSAVGVGRGVDSEVGRGALHHAQVGLVIGEKTSRTGRSAGVRLGRQVVHRIFGALKHAPARNRVSNGGV